MTALPGGTMLARWLRDERVRYLVAGGYNTAVGILLYLLFFWVLADRFHYLVLLLMNHVAGTANSFLSMKMFVFQARGRTLLQYLRFNLVYTVGIGFNFIALPVLVELFGMSPFVAQGVIIVLVVIGGFFAHKRYSFKEPTEQQVSQ